MQYTEEIHSTALDPLCGDRFFDSEELGAAGHGALEPHVDDEPDGGGATLF